MQFSDYKDRINELLSLADKVLSTQKSTSYSGTIVSEDIFNEFRSASLSFLSSLFGVNHTYFKEFDHKVKSTNPYNTNEGKGILKAVKKEIDNGWLIRFKDLVSSEIFTDFMEMAVYLLEEGYKDPAAVIIGGVLEEHLRQLCIKNNIDIEIEKNGKTVSKKADTLNNELLKAAFYNNLDQKNVTAWLDLRNKAAHGKYNEYTLEQVTLLLQSVRDFITRTTG